MASALPRSLIGKAATTTASAAGIINAADRPWVARKTIIHVSAYDVAGVAPHSPDETAKPMIPTSTTSREPNTSAMRPPSAKPAANARMYALIIQVTPLAVRDSSLCTWGAAIATIVWSMKVIATANIIAVRASHLDLAMVPGVPDADVVIGVLLPAASTGRRARRRRSFSTVTIMTAGPGDGDSKPRRDGRLTESERIPDSKGLRHFSKSAGT